MEKIKIQDDQNQTQRNMAEPKEGQQKLKKRKFINKSSSDEESFYPEFHQIKKMGLQVNKKRLASGSWSLAESRIYLNFMLSNREDFLTEKSRRRKKVFYRLSKILKKRTPDQCRSHHQKLQIKCKEDLNSIIGSVKQKIQRQASNPFLIQSQDKNSKGTKVTGTNTCLIKTEEDLRQQQNSGKSWYSLSNSVNGILNLSIRLSAIKGWP